MLRRGLLVVLAGLVAAAVVLPFGEEPIDAKPVRPGLDVGLIVNLEGYDRPGRLKAARLAARTGVRTIRDDLSWEDAQRRRGARFDWRKADTLVTAAATAGHVFLPILNTTPRWAGRSKGAMPDDPADYARFAAAAVARYGPGGRFWRRNRELDARLAPRWFELYNEPYLGLDVPGGPEPAAYARTVVAAVDAARPANPRARFLLAADTTSISPDGDERPWLEALYAAEPELGSHFDGVAVHPYGGGEDPERFTPGDDDRWQTRRIETLRAELVRRGAADKPVWITEIGWSTCKKGGDECVDRRTQARYLAKVFDLASTRWRPWVAAVYVYTLEDFQTPSKDKETAFGIAGRRARPKPAWDVVRTATGARP